MAAVLGALVAAILAGAMTLRAIATSDGIWLVAAIIWWTLTLELGVIAGGHIMGKGGPKTGPTDRGRTDVR